MGGRSAERQVSLSTGRQVLEALDPAKYDAVAVDTAAFGLGPWTEPPAVASLAGATDPTLSLALNGDPLAVLAGGAAWSGRRPDVAFLCLHGQYGEDGTIQGLLELLGIPYTGSGVLASALALNKAMARKVLAAEGLPVAEGVALRGRAACEEYLRAAAGGSGFPAPPVVVKPSCQGSTIGITVARSLAELGAALEIALAFDEEVVIERFVEGVELTGPVLGNDDARCLPLVEIVPRGGFYDYEAKYTPGATEEIVPARIAPGLSRRAELLACRAHQALGCRGMSRTDFIATGREEGAQLVVLEVNTIPGMTPTSLLPRSAEAAGIGFPRLVETLIELALEGRTVATTSAPRA